MLHKMTKNEFMTRYINEMYAKRRIKRGLEADSFLIEGTIKKKNRAIKSKNKGVYKYGEY